MSSSHKTSSISLLSLFRSGIRFLERFMKNFVIQFKWWITSLNKRHLSIHRWIVSGHHHPANEVAIKLIITLIYVVILAPLLIIWVILKSI